MQPPPPPQHTALGSPNSRLAPPPQLPVPTRGWTPLCTEAPSLGRDGILFAIINSGTSILSGFVIFSVLGYMSHVNNIDIDKVAESGDSSTRTRRCRILLVNLKCKCKSAHPLHAEAELQLKDQRCVCPC